LPAPNSETEQFRSTIKAAELAAERLQNQFLVECLPLRPPERDALDPEELRSVLRNVATLFLDKRGGKPVADLLSSINEIVDVATRDAR
jgi:hypothetical protein